MLTDPSPDKENVKTVDKLADIMNKKPDYNIYFVYFIDSKKASDLFLI
jgi:hypothetical protein